jgi:hypothetical protein
MRRSRARGFPFPVGSIAVNLVRADVAARLGARIDQATIKAGTFR